MAMPIYEYRCAKCGRVSSFLVRNTAAHSKPACPHCGGRRMSRAISRVTVVGGKKGVKADRRREADAAPSGVPAGGAADAPPGGGPGDDGPMPDMAGMESLLGGVDENDPRSIGRAMRKLAETAGEPMDGEMEEVVRRLESGEDPEKIEEKMGDVLGGAEGGGGGDELYDG
jgi:putative FmdB family regulatory protein